VQSVQTVPQPNIQGIAFYCRAVIRLRLASFRRCMSRSCVRWASWLGWSGWNSDALPAVRPANALNELAVHWPRATAPNRTGRRHRATGSSPAALLAVPHRRHPRRSPQQRQRAGWQRASGVGRHGLTASAARRGSRRPQPRDLLEQRRLRFLTAARARPRPAATTAQAQAHAQTQVHGPGAAGPA
jgi:hypothetical protein